jgi:Type I restriction enzyme R protein N terminus (HSDR_N)
MIGLSKKKSSLLQQVQIEFFSDHSSDIKNTPIVFDPVRRRNVPATPEEIVRQRWIQYLIQERKYPRALLSVEKELKLNQLKKRCDIVVFNRTGNPFMILEFKSPAIAISNSVFEQIARYNLVLKVPYLVVSNGNQHFCCKIDFDKKAFEFIDQLPALL